MNQTSILEASPLKQPDREPRVTLMRPGSYAIRPNFVGLISENGQCRCELHGFEVDLYGNVVVPELCPKHTQHTNQIPNRRVRM